VNQAEKPIYYHASCFRRLAALVYDSLIVLAVLLLATALAMLPLGLMMGGEALSEQQILVENPIFFSWLMFSWFYYYTWCWRHGGQTVGMKAWRIKLIPIGEDKMTWKQSAQRFLTGALGLANLWALVGARRGWHDIISNTNVVLIPKAKKQS
jgi:uncharacterized RDD family membrane protein YckC